MYTFLVLGLYLFVFLNKLLPYEEENQLNIWVFQEKKSKKFGYKFGYSQWLQLSLKTLTWLHIILKI